MAVEQQVSNGQQGMFNFIIAPVDMKQIFVMTKMIIKRKMQHLQLKDKK